MYNKLLLTLSVFIFIACGGGAPQEGADVLDRELEHGAGVPCPLCAHHSGRPERRRGHRPCQR